ncbi:MAG: hypothetical protein WAL45_13185 [Terracidiphilus sp.]
MRSKTVLVLAIAVAAFIFFGSEAASAKNPSSEMGLHGAVAAAKAQNEAAQMVPAAAVLTQEIDARKLHAGEQFRAQLTQAVYLKNGTALPKGTELVGTVAADKMNAGGPSTLALRFTKAIMENGRAVPIVATIFGVAPPAYNMAAYSDGPAAPDPWNATELNLDEIGVVSGFDLHSSIAGPNSAVFESTKKDEMKLADQSQLSLAIAERGASVRNGGA